MDVPSEQRTKQGRDAPDIFSAAIREFLDGLAEIIAKDVLEKAERERPGAAESEVAP